MVDFLQLSPISRMHLWSSATVIFGFFFTSLTKALQRSVPCHNSVSELFRQFLWPHDSHLLWHALWAVRSYIDRCVAFLIKSNQYNQTQLDSNEGVETSQGWSEEMDSTWVKWVSQQRVWILKTMWYFSFSFLINLQKCQQFCVFLSVWGAVCTLMRKKNELKWF